jgi:hypothetical protein
MNKLANPEFFCHNNYKLIIIMGAPSKHSLLPFLLQVSESRCSESILITEPDGVPFQLPFGTKERTKRAHYVLLLPSFKLLRLKRFFNTNVAQKATPKLIFIVLRPRRQKVTADLKALKDQTTRFLKNQRQKSFHISTIIRSFPA